MENQEMGESYSFLPVLPRLDRLDRLVQLLEEKHGLSGSWRCLCKNENNKQEEEEEEKCSIKTLSSVLDEVQHKGTLLERLSILENRVFQLSLDMEMEEDERNTSKSSSTVVVAAGGDGGGSETFSIGNSGEQEKEQILTPLSIKEQGSKKTCDLEQLKKGHNSSRRQSNKKSNKKMLGWLRMGC